MNLFNDFNTKVLALDEIKTLVRRFGHEITACTISNRAEKQDTYHVTLKVKHRALHLNNAGKAFFDSRHNVTGKEVNLEFHVGVNTLAECILSLMDLEFDLGHDAGEAAQKKAIKELLHL